MYAALKPQVYLLLPSVYIDSVATHSSKYVSNVCGTLSCLP